MQEAETGRMDASANAKSGSSKKPERFSRRSRFAKGHTAVNHDVTRIYLSEIGRSRLLTAEEEAQLEAALDELDARVAADRLHAEARTHAPACDGDGMTEAEREALEERVKELTAELHENNIQLTNEIAQRKRAEHAARESEAKYRMLVENAPVGIVSCDAEGNIEQLNPQLAKILGPAGFDGPDKTNLLTYPPLVSSGISGAVQKCLEAGESVVGEYPYAGAPSKQIYARLHVAPIRLGHRDVGHFFELVDGFNRNRLVAG